MPNGGTLRISGGNTELTKEHAHEYPGAVPGQYLAIEVADTGQGISETLFEKIFDPFFTTKETGKGTGLGLSTVQAIVHTHGGYVTVSSEVGKGTTFRILLPASAAEAVDKPKEHARHLPAGNGETVLVVDDEAAVCDIVRMALESYGYSVLTARDGQHGLAMLQSHKSEIRVVITDSQMPVMSGGEMVELIERISPGLPIVSMSGLRHKATSRESTTRFFLSKPFTAEQLLKTLEAALQSR